MAVLVSGTATLLEAILDAGVEVVVIVADRNCRGVQIGEDAGVPTFVVDRAPFGGFSPNFDREGYSQAVVDTLLPFHPALVAMAGFGTILGQAMHEAFPTRILNTHPSLLPSFPGWTAVKDALEAGVSETGCTVHVATLELDAGPIVIQGRVPIEPGDDVSTLHERIKVVERLLYPDAIGRALVQVRTHGKVLP